MTVSPQLEKRLIDLGFVVIGGVLVWSITKKLGGKVTESVSKTTDSLTKPIADAYVDLITDDVEHTPFYLMDHYLTADYRLTGQAEKVLWGIPQYVPQLQALFADRGLPLRSKYYHLINQKITKDKL